MNASVIMLAANVNDILSRYILIHDQIIKLSIRKLVPASSNAARIRDFCPNKRNALLAHPLFVGPRSIRRLTPLGSTRPRPR